MYCGYMQLIVDTIKPARAGERIAQSVGEGELLASPSDPADRIADRRVRPDRVRRLAQADLDIIHGEIISGGGPLRVITDRQTDGLNTIRDGKIHAD